MLREFKGKSLIALPDTYVVIDTETTGLNSATLLKFPPLKLSPVKLLIPFLLLCSPLHHSPRTPKPAWKNVLM